MNFRLKILGAFVFLANNVIRFMFLVVVLFCAVSCLNGSGNFLSDVSNINAVSTETSLLRDSNIPVNTAAVEIYNIRITPETEQYLDNLWLETDEQVIPAFVRLNLFHNGIRAGVQGSLISPALSRLINVSSNPELSQYVNGMIREASVQELSRELPVSKQFQNLYPDMRVIVKPFNSTIYELALFENEGGQIWGKNYTNVQGQLRLTAKPVMGGKVRFEVIPELEYGVPEMRTYSRQGIIFKETSKPRKVYDSLTIEVDLLPGNWLILGATSENCRGTGRCFFVRGEDQIEQRIIAIRLINLKRPIEEPQLNQDSPSSKSNYLLLERK